MLELRQQIHGKAANDAPKAPTRVLNQAKTTLLQNVFKYMHLLYQDLALTRDREMEPLKKLMVMLANQLNLAEYLAYYKDKESSMQICLTRWINSNSSINYPLIFEKSRVVVRLYEVLN